MKLFRPILALSLAALVLVASSSFTVSMHLCGGRVASVSIVEPAAPCEMELLAYAIAKDKNCNSLATKGCCEDKTLVFDGASFQVKVQDVLTVSSFTPIAIAAPFVVRDLHIPFTRDYPPNVSPPIHIADIPVMTHTFRI